jgi:ACS family tartrate transporter-like MFS transporter
MTMLMSRSPIPKITRRLIPLLCILFIVNYLDRTNVAMAQLRMLGDVGMSDRAFGLGAGLFFIGYFLFEVPSNLILQRVGARRWIARIMISWGICSAALMFTRGANSFYAIRFVLGAAEAGFFPGIVLYLTYWIPHKSRARTLAAFLTSTAISGVIGNPLAGAIMKLEGVGGLHGWQWLFLLEGIPPVVLGLAILCTTLLPDRPADAKWLDDSERLWIERELELEHSHSHVNHVAELGQAMADGRLWLLSAIYFLLIMGLYGFVYWVPRIVKDLTAASDAKVGILSAVPYLVGAITMVIIGRHADRRGHLRAHASVCALLGAIGLVVLVCTQSAAGGMAALCVAAIGIFGSLGPFWCLPTRYLRGTAAAGGIAVVNSVGALSGFVAPAAIGWAKTATGHLTAGLLVVAASLAMGSIVVLMVPRSADTVEAAGTD